MSDRFLLATFDQEEHLREATKAVRAAGCSVVDVYAPYAVHGLDELLGLRPSRLTWVCFVCGTVGALGMFWFEHWTAAINWAINVGGKPWNAWPSDVPVAFEAMVFLASFGTVFAFLLVSRLFPGKHIRPVLPGVTDDRFVLVLEETDAAFDVEKIREVLKRHHAVETEEHIHPAAET